MGHGKNYTVDTKESQKLGMYQHAPPTPTYMLLSNLIKILLESCKSRIQIMNFPKTWAENSTIIIPFFFTRAFLFCCAVLMFPFFLVEHPTVCFCNKRALCATEKTTFSEVVKKHPRCYFMKHPRCYFMKHPRCFLLSPIVSYNHCFRFHFLNIHAVISRNIHAAIQPLFRERGSIFCFIVVGTWFHFWF